MATTAKATAREAPEDIHRETYGKAIQEQLELVLAEGLDGFWKDKVAFVEASEEEDTKEGIDFFVRINRTLVPVDVTLLWGERRIAKEASKERPQAGLPPIQVIQLKPDIRNNLGEAQKDSEVRDRVTRFFLKALQQTLAENAKRSGRVDEAQLAGDLKQIMANKKRSEALSGREITRSRPAVSYRRNPETKAIEMRRGRGAWAPVEDPGKLTELEELLPNPSS